MQMYFNFSLRTGLVSRSRPIFYLSAWRSGRDQKADDHSDDLPKDVHLFVDVFVDGPNTQED